MKIYLIFNFELKINVNLFIFIITLKWNFYFKKKTKDDIAIQKSSFTWKHNFYFKSFKQLHLYWRFQNMWNLKIYLRIIFWVLLTLHHCNAKSCLLPTGTLQYVIRSSWISRLKAIMIVRYSPSKRTTCFVLLFKTYIYSYL